MSPGPPIFRRDLHCSLQETDAGTVFIVKNPGSEQFFRFGAPEHFISQLLDGKTPADVIRQRAEEQFGSALDPETLDQFIESLRRRGLLVVDDAESEHPMPRRGRVRGSLLYLRFKVFDPDRLFDRVIGKVRFFFTSFRRPLRWPHLVGLDGSRL